MLRAVRNLARLMGLGLTLARHDALELPERFGAPRAVLAALRLVRRVAGRAPESVGKRPGERLALAMRAAGPTFVKLGQSLATRGDLLGEDVADDLASLQDQLPPFSFAEARATVEAEFDAPLASLYSSFDEAPVAAASIAQVHFAVTTEGAAVAVKILRPDIEARFARDIDMLSWTAEVLHRTWPRSRRMRLREVMAEFARVASVEMDLRLEAAAASELADNFAGDRSFHVPAVDWRRTGQRVLTAERIRGIPIDETGRLREAGIDPDDVLRKAAGVFFNQIFRDGFFHADLHPGNLFVGYDGTLVAVDFGIMGRLDWPTRRFLAEMLIGFLQRDYGRVADVHFAMGFVPPDQPRDIFMQACRAIGEPILDLPLNEISVARLLAQLFRVTEAFRMETQPQLLLLQKTLMVAEGVGRKLNPGVNMWDMSRPLIEGWGRDYLGPEARIRAGMRDIVAGLERLPAFVANLDRAVQALAEQGYRLHPETVRHLRGEDEAGRGGRPGGVLWLIAGLLAAILAVLVLRSA